MSNQGEMMIAKFIRVASVLLVAFLATGCVQTEAGFSPQDQNFAEMMIPHHQQAIEMADLALQKSQNEEVIALATQIKAAQDPEIVEMSSWPGVNPETHRGHAMDGMLSDDEMQELREADSLQFDRLFVQGMIKHHQGAIDMADEVKNSDNEIVSNLARSIISTQRDEIQLMEDLLTRL